MRISLSTSLDKVVEVTVSRRFLYLLELFVACTEIPETFSETA